MFAARPSLEGRPELTGQSQTPNGCSEIKQKYEFKILVGKERRRSGSGSRPSDRSPISSHTDPMTWRGKHLQRFKNTPEDDKANESACFTSQDPFETPRRESPEPPGVSSSRTPLARPLLTFDLPGRRPNSFRMRKMMRLRKKSTCVLRFNDQGCQRALMVAKQPSFICFLLTNNTKYSVLFT